jgi:hypothetical protein
MLYYTILCYALLCYAMLLKTSMFVMLPAAVCSPTPSPLCKFTRTRPALSSQAQRKPQIPLTHRQHVSVDTQRPQLRAFQAGLPEVSARCPTTDKFTLLTTPQTATTLRMAPSFATSMPAGRLPRLSRPRWVPSDATRSSSTTSRR